MPLSATLAPEIALLIDLFIFFSYIVIAGFLLYVGKTIGHKRDEIKLPWILLSAGLLFTSLNIFVEMVGILTGTYAISLSALWFIFKALGSLALILGFATVILEKVRIRQLEVNDVIGRLEAYYKKPLGKRVKKR